MRIGQPNFLQPDHTAARTQHQVAARQAPMGLRLTEHDLSHAISSRVFRSRFSNWRRSRGAEGW